MNTRRNIIVLRSKALMLLKAWDKCRKRATKDRSLELEQTALQQIFRLRGYLDGLEIALQQTPRK